MTLLSDVIICDEPGSVIFGASINTPNHHQTSLPLSPQTLQHIHPFPNSIDMNQQVLNLSNKHRIIFFSNSMLMYPIKVEVKNSISIHFLCGWAAQAMAKLQMRGWHICLVPKLLFAQINERTYMLVKVHELLVIIACADPDFFF